MPIFDDVWLSPADAGVPVACDWSPLLPAGAVLASSGFAIDGTQPSVDGALVLTDGGFSGTVATVRLSGGTRGLGTRVVNTITYVDQAGVTVTLQRGFWVKVRGTL